MSQSNHDSFLIFSDSGGREHLPTPFDWDNGDVNPEVVLVSGESYALYIKGNVPAISTISNGVSDFPVTSSATSISGLAFTHTLLTFSIGGGIPSGGYFFKAGSLVSQEVAVLTAGEAAIDTAYVEFSNVLTLGDFYYPYAEGFVNKIRIRLNTLGTRPFTDKKTYSTSSDGNSIRSRKVNLWGRRELYTTFQTVDYRDFIHLACEMMTHHETIKINNIQYSFRDDSLYTFEPNGTLMSNGEFGLTRNDSILVIRS